MRKELQGYWQQLEKVLPEIPKISLKRVPILILLFGLVFVLLAFVTYHLAYWHRIYPGVKVANQSVGNLTTYEAEQKLLAKSFLATESANLVLHSGKQKWLLRTEKIDFSYDAIATAKEAFRLGRSGHFVTDIQTKIKAWLRGINLNWQYSFNQSLLDKEVDQISYQVFIPAVEPTIKVAEEKIIIEEGKTGQELDRRKLLNQIHYQWATLNQQSIEIPLIQINPQLNQQQVGNTQQRAEKFLGKKLILTDNGNHWQLEDREMIQFLSFTNGFNQDKIASWSAELASTIDRPPQNATFRFVNNRATEFQPAREGQKLDQQQAVNLIAESLMALETMPANGKNTPKEITASLPITTTPPAIKTADVNSLGIKTLIGQGISYFRGSITSRIHNIKLAASRINGLLVAPNEVFSFNQSLGEIDKSTGYQEAYIIKEGRTILGDGGGVCQVSTTLFRAILSAGLPVIERKAHAYRVAYYEQNSPVGLDATVFAPTADLKFKNDTPAHILIQTQVNTRTQSLTFDLYGTDDGRIVSLSKSRVWDQIPPPPDLYQDDPTLPAGIIKQIDWKAWGAKVAFDYQVTRHGEILQDRTFYSSYHPWQAVFLRGTGS